MNWDKWEIRQHWESIHHLTWWRGKSQTVAPLEIVVSDRVKAGRRVLALRNSIEDESGILHESYELIREDRER
jgi:hypothetical protein